MDFHGVVLNDINIQVFSNCCDDNFEVAYNCNECDEDICEIKLTRNHTVKIVKVISYYVNERVPAVYFHKYLWDMLCGSQKSQTD